MISKMSDDFIVPFSFPFLFSFLLAFLFSLFIFLTKVKIVKHYYMKFLHEIILFLLGREKENAKSFF